MNEEQDVSMGICGKVDLESVLKQSLEEIKNSAETKALLESIINRSPAVIFFWSAEDGRPVEFVTENVERFGYNKDDFVSGTLLYHNILHPDDRENVRNAISTSVAEGKEQFNCEYRLLTESEDVRWVYESTLIERNTDQSVSHFYGIIFDITHRKLAEKEIADNERDISVLYSAVTLASESLDIDDLLSEILMEIGDLLDIEAGGVYIIDHDKREANLRAHIGPEEELTSSISYSKEEDMFKNVADLPKHAIISEEVVRKGSRFVTRNNLTFYLYSHDKVVGFVLLLTSDKDSLNEKNIKVLEHVGKHIGIAIENAQLFEKTQGDYEDLRSVDKMKNEFFANLSHELKTPMISIKGFSELLGEGKFGTLTTEQKRANDAVVRNAEKLRSLIDSLLYMSMEKEGKYKYNFTTVSVRRFIGNSIEVARAHAGANNIVFKEDIPENIPNICGDEERLSTALNNIIDNAVKFMSEGEVTVSVQDEPDQIHIRVKDNGIGIPKDEVDKVFDSFYQVDGSLTRIHGGTGLGLHVSKRIIDVHNGNIWLKSLEGFGTTVHITLPK
ncbi:cell wall metabolism sensor histidine kinase WalK [Methanococcoides methylutens]|uniref:histidine kinase n=1 Tax=Methanococcoides methylutens MM1 TaxID=1434104 RepID=A0A0E3SRN3_METMT|nr:ATP-binding protein [Methanococcoides methylutens]AKB84877.1 Sensory transduction histidine kinase [Methanococcoides methylutens MM1]